MQNWVKTYNKYAYQVQVPANVSGCGHWLNVLCLFFHKWPSLLCMTMASNAFSSPFFCFFSASHLAGTSMLHLKPTNLFPIAFMPVASNFADFLKKKKNRFTLLKLIHSVPMQHFVNLCVRHYLNWGDSFTKYCKRTVAATSVLNGDFLAQATI